MAKRGNQDAARRLVAPPLDPEDGYLWDWFWELHQRRSSGAMGPAAFSWPDFDAWSRHTGAEPEPWELDVLSAMDRAFFEVAAVK